MPKASPKSKTFKKGTSTSAENNGQKPLIEKCGRTVEYCQSPGREHVAALLDISEERSALELGPYDSPAESGWDETVTGWHRYPPLACFSHAQKRKTHMGGEPGHHCLLCAEIKPTKLPESKEDYPTLSDAHQTNNDIPSIERSWMSAVHPGDRGEQKSHENPTAGIVHLGRKTPEEGQRHIQGPVLVKNWRITSITSILPPVMQPRMASGNCMILPILKKMQNAVGGVARGEQSHCTNVARKKATGKRSGNVFPSAPTEDAGAVISHGSLSKDFPASFSNGKPQDAPLSPHAAALPPISWPFQKQQKAESPQQCSIQEYRVQRSRTEYRVGEMEKYGDRGDLQGVPVKAVSETAKDSAAVHSQNHLCDKSACPELFSPICN